MIFPQKNFYVCGRGATAIYLVLQTLKQQDHRRGIIVPANICYAAVYPIIFAGFVPVFCDVSPCDGNISLNCIIAKMDPSIRGILVPHMYGNPVQSIVEISLFCRQKNLVLIEDCASAMGADLPDGSKVGAIGDYSIYSTGYAKTIDLGIGGIVTSNNKLNDLKEIEETLPSYTSEIHEKEQSFSLQYRRWRNSGIKLENSMWESFFYHTDFHDIFLFKINDKIKRNIIDEIEKNIDYEVKRRRQKYEIYSEKLREISSIKIYQYYKGGVPWRFSIFVPPSQRRRIIDLLLSEKQPVSDWYPSVTQLFKCFDVFPGAEKSGCSILNFPLNLSEEEINQLCGCLVENIRKVL